MNCLCGHSQTQHDPEDKVCDAHATEGLGRCPCPRFVPSDETQLRVAWNRAGLYDIAARERRAARDERDLYRKECERLREQLHDQEARRLQLLDDAGGTENERDALRREVTLLQKENAALRDAMVKAARRLGRAQQEAERERDAARSDVEAQVEAAHARGAAETLAEVVRKIRDERSLCEWNTTSRAAMDRILDVVASKEPAWEDE